MLNEAMLVSKETWAEYMHPGNRVQDLSRLRQLEVPTLVMIGDKDNMLPLAMQHKLAELIPNAQKIVFEGEGHGLAGENPEAVFKAMFSFLEQLP